MTTSSFLQLPNDSPAKQRPVPNNDSPAKQCPVPKNYDSSFKQLSVPHDGPTHFMQTFVPTTTTSTGLQANIDCPSSLNDVTNPQAFCATTASTTATMTQVPTITRVTTKVSLKLDKCFLNPTKTGANNATMKSESLVLHAQFCSAILTTRIHMQNLLLLPVQDDSAILIATNASYSLQLIVESFSTGAKQVAPATIRNHSFKLIDELASEGALFAPYILENAFTYTNELNHEGAWAQAASFQVSKLIVIYFKIFFLFCEDCRIFCEREWQVKDDGYAFAKQQSANIQEWEQQWQLNGHIGLVGPGLTGHPGLARLTGLVNHIGLIDFIDLHSLISLVGRIGCNSLTSLIGLIGILNGHIGCNGSLCCIGLVSLIEIVNVGLIGFIGHISLIGHNGLFGFGLVNHNGLVSIFRLVSLGFVGINCLVSFIGLVGLIGLVLDHISLISLVGLIGLIGFIGLVSLVSFGLNDFIGIGIIVNSLQFKIEMKQS
jgi:hypothetical protein